MAKGQRWGWVLALGLVLGCSGGPGTEEHLEQKAIDNRAPMGASQGLSDMAAEAPPAPARNPGGQPAADPSRSEPRDAAASNRYIIRRASLSLQVKDVRRAMARVGELAEAYGGFVSDANMQATEGVPPSASMTLRVPAKRFDEALERLGNVGEVRAKTITGEDVSMEYVDTQARIRNLQRQEEQLLKLLNRAGKLSEVLEVERELARVRGRIEQSQARLRHLSALVDLATIQVSLTEQVQVASTSPWQLPAVVENAWQNAQRELADAVAGVVRGLIWLFAFVLPLLLPALVLFLLVGWGLRVLLVEKRHVMDAVLFRRLWLAVGIGLLCLAYPPLIGYVLLVAGILFVIWAGAGLWRRLTRKREEA